MGFAPAPLVTGAARQPLPYGLFSVLTFRPSGEARWEVGGVEFEGIPCDPVQGIGFPNCDPEGATVGLPKNLVQNGSILGDASAFTVYGHYNCTIGSDTPSEAQDKATAHLLTYEERRVEQAFWTGDLGNDPSLEHADTVTLGGGDVSAEIGVGLLEAFIATNYGSLGVLHVSRSLATVLLRRDVLTTSGSRLTTALGTPAVAGAGYPGSGPTGQAVAGHKEWAYVTPALFGYRSEPFTSSATPGDLYDLRRNDAYAIAERNYLLGFDPCGVAAVLIDPAL